MSNIQINPYAFAAAFPPFTESFWGAGGTSAAWTSGTFSSSFTSGVWSTRSALNTAVQLTTGAGTQSDSKIMGGDTSPAGGGGDTLNPVSEVQDWNGTAFTTGTPMTTIRNGATGGGESGSATWIAGGISTVGSEVYVNNMLIWNGSTWSAGGNLTYSGGAQGGCGNVDSGLTITYYNAGTSDVVNSYDGTTWTTGAVFPYSSGSAQSSGAGQNNDAIITSGNGYSVESWTYDGLAWTRGGDTAHLSTESANMGTPRNAMNCMGYVGSNIWNPTWAELYNGTTWSATGSMVTGRVTGGHGN